MNHAVATLVHHNRLIFHPVTHVHTAHIDPSYSIILYHTQVVTWCVSSGIETVWDCLVCHAALPRPWRWMSISGPHRYLCKLKTLLEFVISTGPSNRHVRNASLPPIMKGLILSSGKITAQEKVVRVQRSLHSHL